VNQSRLDLLTTEELRNLLASRPNLLREMSQNSGSQNGGGPTGQQAPPHVTVTPMPLAGARGAPCFDGKKVRELPRFMRRVEELFIAVGLTDDQEKKESILKYLDIDIEDQWTVLTKYSTGTWNEWKAEILKQYPELGTVKEGSLSQVDDIVQTFKGLNFGTGNLVPEFVREFRTEVHKLMGNQALLSNHEAVKLFMKAFTVDAAKRLSDRLKMGYLAANMLPNAPARAQRRSEDRFDLEEVFDAALEMAHDGTSSLYDSTKDDDDRDKGSFRDGKSAKGKDSASDVKQEERTAMLSQVRGAELVRLKACEQPEGHQ
jgi:hypothetical protein